MKVELPPRPVSHGFTLIELLVVIAIIAILAAILFPVFAKAREKARQTQCMNNQKQMATSILMYVQENDEKVPDSQNVWSTIDVPAKVRICPTAGKALANGYVYNNNISGVSLGDIDFPVETLLIADGQGDGDTTAVPVVYANIAYSDKNLAARHNNATITAYVDGHVELVKKPTILVKSVVEGFEDDTKLRYGMSAGTWHNFYGRITNTAVVQGLNSAELHYDALDKTSNCYISMIFSDKLTRPRLNNGHFVNFMVNGGNCGFVTVVRLLDAQYEMFQYDYGKSTPSSIDFSGWKEVSLNIDRGASSSGAAAWVDAGATATANGKLDWPVSVYEILFDRRNAANPQVGSIYIDNITVSADGCHSYAVTE